jgi:hypothetical protein
MRDGAKLDRDLFRNLADAVYSAQHLMRESAARVRVVLSGSRWRKGRYASLDLHAAAFATGPESYVWIAAPRLASVALMLELLLAVTLTFAMLVHVQASEVE